MKRSEQNASINLDQILDQAIAHLHQGESLDACLARYPEYAAVLEPLLQVSAELQAAADIALPQEMEEWLAVGAQEFAMLAEREGGTRRIEAPAPSRQRSPRRAARAADMATIFDAALSRTMRGESTDMVLASYSDHADELAELLHTAAQIREMAATPLPAEMEAWLVTTGVQEFSALAEQAGTRKNTRRVPARMLTPQRVTAAALVAAVLLGTVDTASANSLPGQPLYEWKLAHEGISAALTLNPSEQSKVQLSYAEKRTIEVKTLVEQGVPGDDERVTSTLKALARHLNAAVAEADEANTAKTIEPIVKRISSEAKNIIAQASQSSPDKPTTPQAADNVTEDTLAEVQEQLSDVQKKLATSVEAENNGNIASNPTTVPPSATRTAQPGIASSVAIPSTASQPSIAAEASIIGSTPTATIAEPSLPPRTPTSTSTALPGIAAPIEPDTPVPVAPTNVPAPTNQPAEQPVPTRVPPTQAPTEPPAPTQAPPEAAVPTATPTATAIPEPSVPVPPPTVPSKPSRPTPTATTVPPTATTVPPTEAPTQVPPTATSVPPTEAPTQVPPTATSVPPTEAPTEAPTQVPPTATPTLTPTLTATPTLTTTATTTPTVGIENTPLPEMTPSPEVTSLPETTPTAITTDVTNEPIASTPVPPEATVMELMPTKVIIITLPTEIIEPGGILPPPLNPTLTAVPPTPLPTVVFNPIGTVSPSPVVEQPTTAPTTQPTVVVEPTAAPTIPPTAKPTTVVEPTKGLEELSPASKPTDEADGDT